jgi:protein-tyrosine phosphatase
VRDDWPTDAGGMEYRVAELRHELEEQRIPLDVRPGGEIALEWLEKLSAEELRRFGLGGNPRYLLVEMPYYGWPLALPDLLLALIADGITPVLAHPERNADVQADPARLQPLVSSGVLVQVTAASIDGRIGRPARQCARLLIDSGLVHLLASDAHHPSVRAIGMDTAAAAVGSEPLATWLTLGVPAAILDDTELPPRPPGGGRSTGWLARLLGPTGSRSAP